MHWLQALDTRLFYFINHSLSNPLFDWLMPILSGGKWFVLLAALAALAAIFSKDLKLRACVLMLLFVLAIGDGLITNTVKHAIGRPRPFVVLPDARVFGVVGKGYVPPSDTVMVRNNNNNSMPSSHAANAFAAVMVAFLFYRRSWRFLLPLALGVAFSRVYNGVHYPTDVLAGAILGAGYAVAIVGAVQFTWNGIGKRWFPAWHARCPSLLNPERQQPDTGSPISELEWLHLGYLLIFLMLVGRLVYLGSGTIQLTQDEAYQWTWSKHPALSYYSKPPGIAMIQFAGTHLFGDTPFGVRFFSPVIAAILTLLLLRFLARETTPRTAFCLLIAVTATPLLGVGTILMTIDPPLVLCWTWAMIAGWRAMRPDSTRRHWLVVGFALGLGFLCKYTAVFQIVCWAILFVLSPAARMHLKKSGPWLALLVFSACTLPVIAWNASHHWITITHVTTNAGLHGKWHPTLRYFLDFMAGQCALLNPIFFVGAIWAMFASWKSLRQRPLWLYFFCMGAPIFLGHWLYSLHSRIFPNWIGPAVMPMFCLMVVYWDEKFRAGWRFVKPVFIAGVTLGLVFVAIAYQTKLLAKVTGSPLPSEMDPTRRANGWSQSAVLAENEREKLQAEGKPAFIICSHYGLTGLYSFYLPEARQAMEQRSPLVYAGDSDEPENQFYFWPEYDYRATRKGQNAIFVSEAKLYKLESGWIGKWLTHKPIDRITPPVTTLPSSITDEFESVTDLGEQDVKMNDRVFHRIHLWKCYNLK